MNVRDTLSHSDTPMYQKLGGFFGMPMSKKKKKKLRAGQEFAQTEWFLYTPLNFNCGGYKIITQ